LPGSVFGSLLPIPVEDFFCTEVDCEESPPVAKLLLRSVDPGLKKFTFEMLPTGSFCFPKTRRLTHRSEYERVKQDGITQRGKLLILNVMPVEDSGPWRAGFVTSGRLGGAVVRNRVRRRLREIVRRQQHQLRQGFWFVIIARDEAASASYGTLEDEWLRLARRASILL
jgi:ribonuclease P protein component